MKKLLLTLLLGAIMSVGFTQTTSEQRNAIRAQRQAKSVTQLTTALKNQNFTFTAQTMTPAFGFTVNVSGINNFLSFENSFLDCQLPYNSVNPTLVFQSMNFTASDYNYSFNVVGTTAYVVAVAPIVVNMDGHSTVPQGVVIHIQVDLNSGNATLTIAPTLNSAVTYSGSCNMN
ncbi:MAG: DUF4251 domain-containing protein [Mucinivorans sp.]